MVTYIIPLPIEHEFFTNNPSISEDKFQVIQQNAPSFIADYEKRKEKGFVHEALDSMQHVMDLLEIKQADGYQQSDENIRKNLSMLRAVYLGRNLERVSLSTTTIIGKAVGLANIGTTIQNDYFIFNRLIGCALISCEGSVDPKGIITGTWLVGFENVPGVVALFDFSRKDTEVVPDKQARAVKTRVELLADIVVSWFKDRSWNMSNYSKQTICFTSETLDAQEH